MGESVQFVWRCRKCRKTLFKYDEELSGFMEVQCPDPKCKYTNTLLFLNGEGYQINKQLTKKRTFLKKALKDLPVDIVNDIMTLLSK